jgi:putative DNA methylase
MNLPRTYSVGEADISDAHCFIEQQFPVSKLSMESYKERVAKQGQTLTGLGKWWGRKPLVLVRAALLGLLMPVSDDPHKDRDIFLKLMTMDEEGLRQRKSKNIPGARLLEELLYMPPSVQEYYLQEDEETGRKKLRRLSKKEERDELQFLIFDRLPYDEKIKYCDRPEQINGPSPAAWQEINEHLGTQATTLTELVEELGQRRFGRRVKVGDAFCGGGSVPFESARLGCNVFASDLNPVATLQTWAAINIIGGGKEAARAVERIQKEVYKTVDRKITDWGIEHNSLGWRADAYLYCVEVLDPESGWKVPLAPSWVIGEKTNTIARLVPDYVDKRYEIEIIEGVTNKELKDAANKGTVKNTYLIPPDGSEATPIDIVRRNWRLWEKEDLVPRPDDVFQERLYCIRWMETNVDKKGKVQTVRHYRAPTPDDYQREARVHELLHERFQIWQEKGYIPSLRIESGDKTDEPIRTRGWSYWHHLFNPRQLLLLGLLMEQVDKKASSLIEKVGLILGVGRSADYNAKLSRWHSHRANEKSEQVFSNQALNTLYNYGTRSVMSLVTAFELSFPPVEVDSKSKVIPTDARLVSENADFWITDPPYADAINYEEITEFFLAWYDKHLTKLFPSWYSDSKRALAVKGNDENFRRSMIDCYQHLAERMPDNGLQIVMFTHQDAAVWADLSLILWAAGLRVTAAWTIATETNSALKKGNYVQGTVLLVLRKRTETEPVFLDEINYRVEAEVRRQLDAMNAMDDDSDPNFGDADYQLAAYAAALRVLTERPIYEIDPEKEILRPRAEGEVGPIEKLIRQAVKIACDHLVPRGIDQELWKHLGPMERFYIKGLEVESHGEYRNGVYQELARGFGAFDYDELLANTKANETRLKRPSEFGNRMLNRYATAQGFPGSFVRQCLFAVALTGKSQETRQGLNYLRTELEQNYWNNRERIVHLLDYLSRLGHTASMKSWRKDSYAAGLLSGAVRNDHI